jgi:hypothetical protein
MSTVAWAIVSVSIAACGVLAYYVYTALPQVTATANKPKKQLSKKKLEKQARKERAQSFTMAE